MDSTMNKEATRHHPPLYYPELSMAASAGLSAISSAGEHLYSPKDFLSPSLPLQDGTESSMDPDAAYNAVINLFNDHIEQTTTASPIQEIQETQEAQQPRRNVDVERVASLSLKEPTGAQQVESPSDAISDDELYKRREMTEAPTDSETSYSRSERALQKAQDTSSAPESDHQTNTSLRRSNRKRTQRMLLSSDPQSLDLRLPAMTPTLRSRSRSRSRSQKKNNATRCSQSSSGNSQQQRCKRRHTSNARDSDSSSSPGEVSVDSELDFEVSIYTEGTAVPHTPATTGTTQICFMCNKGIYGDTTAVNAHIDQCLAESADGPHNSGANGAGEKEEEGPMVAYEWGGQTRIRATAMLEGGVVAAGLGFGSSSAYKDNNDDIDVDEDDETNYGATQYTDKDLVLADRSKRVRGGSGHRRRPSGPQFEEYAVADDSSDSPAQQNRPAKASSSSSAGDSASAASQLVIDALKKRLKDQERLLQTVQKCLICLEAYDKPCTSINCWHVYCEKCWLHTLGTKKLCPQCLQITQPTDLRRVYL